MQTVFSTPAWVHNAIFYQIFPDRFAYSPALAKPNNLEAWDAPATPWGFKGGDLLGVCEHLDYLQDLGVNALYFTPVFQSASNHRYHTHDYFQVDPLLGGTPALERLLKEAHQRGLRVVLDGVFNHASRGFFQFNHILECGAQSPYLDWFKVHGFPLHAYEGKPNYECWWDLAALPQFNHANPQVQEFILSVARYWLEKGIDGWRLDVPFCVEDDAFWQAFRVTVKQANPEAYITGEIPWLAQRWLQGDQFDGVMNYLFTYACWSFFGGRDIDMELVGHWYEHGPDYFTYDAPAFAAKMTELLTLYPQPAAAAQLNLLGSHDTARVISIMRGDKQAFKLAEFFQFTYPGAPSIYYGDEVGMQGGKDPDCRQAFRWEEAAWDEDLRAWTKALVALRNQHAALRTGSFKVIYAAGQTLAYLRQDGGETLLALINRADSRQTLDLSGLTPAGAVKEVLFGAPHNDLRALKLAPLSAALLRLG